MAMLTDEERKWVRRVQRALDDCPSDRIGFYTIGDCDVSMYDKTSGAEERSSENCTDMYEDIEDLDAGLGALNFPACVIGLAG